MKREIMNEYMKFFELDIFEQSHGVASILISLFNNSSRRTAITNEIENLVNITGASIDMYLNPEMVSYTPAESSFDIDTSYNNSDGYKFKCSRNTNLPHTMQDAWMVILSKLQNKYMSIIQTVADILDNPVLTENSFEDRVDPFKD